MVARSIEIVDPGNQSTFRGFSSKQHTLGMGNQIELEIDNCGEEDLG